MCIEQDVHLVAPSQLKTLFNLPSRPASILSLARHSTHSCYGKGGVGAGYAGWILKLVLGVVAMWKYRKEGWIKNRSGMYLYGVLRDPCSCAPLLDSLFRERKRPQLLDVAVRQIRYSSPRDIMARTSIASSMSRISSSSSRTSTSSTMPA